MATFVASLFAGWATARGFAEAAVQRVGIEGEAEEVRGSRHRKEANSRTATDDNSVANELGFGIGDAGEILVSKAQTPFPSRRERRTKRSRGFGRAPNQQVLDDSSLASAFLPDISSPAGPSRPSASPQTKKSKRAIAQTAVMALLLVVVVAWVAKQITAYKRATANLSLMRSDRQHLINQMEAGHVVPHETKKHPFGAVHGRFPSKSSKSGSLDLDAEDRDAHADEDLLNKELTTKLLSARSRVALLQQKIEDARIQLSKEGKSGPRVTPSAMQIELLTKEEALKEKAQLEEELVQLRTQRADLEAILKIQEDIRAHERNLKQGTAMVLSAGKNLGELGSVYSDLNELQRAYKLMHDEERAEHVEMLKVMLKEALEGARKSCSGAPGVAELDLLFEKEELQRELLSLREDIAARSGTPAALAILSKVTELPARYVKGSADLVRKATGVLWPSQGSDATERASAKKQRTQKEGKILDEPVALSSLRHEVEELEHVSATERQVLDLLHSYDAEQFGAWLSQKGAQAAEEVGTIIEALRALHGNLSLKIKISGEDRRKYSELIKSSTAAALNVVKQLKQ